MTRGISIGVCAAALFAAASAVGQSAPRKAQALSGPVVGCFLTETTRTEARCKASDFDLTEPPQSDELQVRYGLKMRSGRVMWVRARDVLFFDQDLSVTPQTRLDSGAARIDTERSAPPSAMAAPQQIATVTPSATTSELSDFEKNITIKGNTIITAHADGLTTSAAINGAMANTTIGSSHIKGDTQIQVGTDNGPRFVQASLAPGVPHCQRKLGTLAIVEGNDARGWSQYGLASPEKMIRAIVQRSGCFNLVDRGAGLGVAEKERAIAGNLGLQRGSNVGQGQVKAADYVLVAELQGSDSHAGGGAVAGAIGSLIGGKVGGLVGGVKTKKLEANTQLSLTNVRTTETLSVAEGYAVKNDIGWGAGGGVGFAGAVGGGYEDTDIGRIVTLSFIDSYTKMVADLGLLSAGPSAAAAAPFKTFVARHEINMRDAASADGKLIRTLPAGTIVYPTGKTQDRWWEVADENNLVGWVLNNGLEPAR